jgi:hypothetical protein
VVRTVAPLRFTVKVPPTQVKSMVSPSAQDWLPAVLTPVSEADRYSVQRLPWTMVSNTNDDAALVSVDRLHRAPMETKSPAVGVPFITTVIWLFPVAIAVV